MNNKNFKKPFNKKKKEKVVEKKKPMRLLIPVDCTKAGVEYTMTETLANNILLENKDKSRTPQEKLCEWVNENCSLMGYCVRVSYF
jgi:hypothetical protein